MYQKIIVVGRVGSKPELRTTPAGIKVAGFTLAENHKYRRDGEPVSETTWFSVSVWGHPAEIAEQYLQKGALVLVEGRMIADAHGNQRQYTKDGRQGSKFEITAANFRMLSSKEAEQEAAGSSEEYPF